MKLFALSFLFTLFVAGVSAQLPVTINTPSVFLIPRFKFIPPSQPFVQNGRGSVCTS